MTYYNHRKHASNFNNMEFIEGNTYLISYYYTVLPDWQYKDLTGYSARRPNKFVIIYTGYNCFNLKACLSGRLYQKQIKIVENQDSNIKLTVSDYNNNEACNEHTFRASIDFMMSY